MRGGAGITGAELFNASAQGIDEFATLHKVFGDERVLICI